LVINYFISKEEEINLPPCLIGISLSTCLLYQKLSNMNHLTPEQRYTISVMLKANYSRKEIASAIGKDKSVLSREINRNCDQRNGEYKSDLATKNYEQGQAEKPRHITFTSTIKGYVIKGLKNDLSPEQIAGRAKLDGISCVSHERIYQYVWREKKEGGNLFEHLRHTGRKYRRRGSAKDKRGIIKDRVDIEQREKIVDEKTRFGDLEIDTVIGQNHQGALLTINDRVTSLVWIRLLESKHAEPLTESTIQALMPLKEELKTITSDNGKEFAKHQEIAQALDINFYFAKPYHSWERGANENTNGLIRQYFPKGTSFENITHQQVEYVQNKLNNRPRKKLGFLSPNEFYQKKFSNQKVAFVT
jgi:IS30 family transposase